MTVAQKLIFVPVTMSSGTHKDYFSFASGNYSKFRPVYPPELFEWIYSHCPGFEVALDCGTGNGQVAALLATKFKTVYATDISENQLAEAVKMPNIIYRLEPAENPSCAGSSVDLVTVAQALHWFNLPDFYNSVKRILKPGGILAVTGYVFPGIDPETDIILRSFYDGTLGDYWPPERKLIDDHYRTIPFPFDEIASPDFTMAFDWTLSRFVAYLRTWSAVNNFIKTIGHDPVIDLEKQLAASWNSDEKRKVNFPLILRVGRNDR